MQTKSNRDIGYAGETAVCKFLQKNGYEILKRNYTIRGGEIDIIAKKNDCIAFVEVKTRKFGALQCGEEAVTKSKQKRIIKTAQRYFSLLDEPFSGRFDVAVVEMSGEEIKKIKYYVSAFDASTD
ncbi:MAG: YraN family protein [Ruminococcus sp.]|nr:YraN family protein [Ruminococcus sp.]